jgi:arylformamidase
MKIHDISMPLINGMPVWPGDEAYAFKQNSTQAKGDGVNVGEIRLSVHVGTHADSPWHVDSNGVTIERLDLAIFVGPAVVLDVSGVELIEPIHLEAAAGKLGSHTLASLIADVPRLLLRTTSWPDRAIFPETFATLSEPAAALVVKSGARLLGVDVPSVDTRDSKSLSIHHMLIGRHRIGAGVQIIESIMLDHIRPGFYELIALPLNVVGGDGAPVRAVLVER